MNKIKSLVIGHRGASAYAPENSLASFQKALELGVGMIECDVRQCASGQLVLVHDPYVHFADDTIVFIADMSLTQLHGALGGQPCMTVPELLAWSSGKIKINFDIKERGVAKKLARLLQHEIDAHRYKITDFLVASFIHQEVVTMKDLMPGIPVGFLLASSLIDYGLSLAKLSIASIMVIDYEVVTHEFIRTMHDCGIGVYVYTVNTVRDINAMIAMGVDGIISDVPDVVKRCLG